MHHRLFLAAAHFSILTKVCREYGAKYIAPIRPHWLLPGFVSVDLVSMIVQAVGSALAADAETSNKSVYTVNDEGNIVGESGRQLDTLLPPDRTIPRPAVVGLCIQLLGYGIFNCIFLLFAYRIFKERRNGKAHDTTAWLDARMKLFLAWAWISSLLVFGRSIFRTVEMIEGWIGEISTSEWYILSFDSALVVLAVIILAFISPTKYIAHLGKQAPEAEDMESTTAHECDMEMGSLRKMSTMEA